jgi:hypothetical protein
MGKCLNFEHILSDCLLYGEMNHQSNDAQSLDQDGQMSDLWAYFVRLFIFFWICCSRILSVSYSFLKLHAKNCQHLYAGATKYNDQSMMGGTLKQFVSIQKFLNK